MKNDPKILSVPYSPSAAYRDGVDVWAGTFSAVGLNRIYFEPWPAAAIKPDVKFRLFYGDDAVFLKFIVQEKYFRATCTRINDPVYQDSCVEFFIGFERNGPYYNFEFNASGIPLAGYGAGRERELLEISLIERIRIDTTHKEKTSDMLPFHWELTAVIPFDVFCKHRLSTLTGAECYANFYKCGDLLPEPHFLCWNNIEASQPDFHLPQYFGKLMFN